MMLPTSAVENAPFESVNRVDPFVAPPPEPERVGIVIVTATIGCGMSPAGPGSPAGVAGQRPALPAVPTAEQYDVASRMVPSLVAPLITQYVGRW